MLKIPWNVCWNGGGGEGGSNGEWKEQHKKPPTDNRYPPASQWGAGRPKSYESIASQQSNGALITQITTEALSN